MATKTLNTRITLKADTTANWAASTLVLLKGEQAFEITESGAWKAKVGDGVNTFKDLSYITMTPEEISALIASGAIQTVSLTSGTNNGTLKLTVDGVTTDNIAVKGLGTAAYTNAGAYATAAQGTLATNAVRKVATGTANGTISVTTGTGAATNVAVKGLGTAAYTASNAYATAAQGTKADNAMPKGGGTFTGAVTLAADPTADLQPTTKQYVDSKISSSIAASDAMVFKGTLGTNGTATALPASSVVVGDTYKVITQVTVPKTNSYTGADVVAKIGDLVVAMSKDPKWIVVPSGDEIVTTVKYSTTTQNLTTNAQSGAITVGEAATKQVDTSITSGTTSTKLPTSKAVADYVTWGNVAGKPSTFTPSAHTHTKDQVGLENVDNTADKDKFVKYATSAGYANSALKLQTYKQGSTTETYGTQYMLYAQWEDSSNLRLKIDNYTTKVNYADNAGNAASASSVDWSNVKNKPSTYTPSAHTHTIANVTGLQGQLDTRALSKTLSSEDLNTIVTPGFYTAGGGNTCKNKPSNVDNFGLIVTHNATGSYYTQIIFKTTDNISYRRYCNNGTWSSWVQDRLTDTNTWRPVVNNLTSDATDQSLSAAQGKALKTLVDGKAAAGHTHSQYYDSGVSRTANTVLAAPDGKNGTATFRKLVAADIPSIPKSKISDFPGALKNPTSLKVQLNGGTTEGTNQFTYDGSATKTINITASSVGASAVGHTHNYAGSSSAGGNANAANSLALLTSTRPTSMNYDLTSSTYYGKVTYSIASSSTTTGKPSADALVLTYGWDTNAGYGAQMAILNGQSTHLQIRGATSASSNNKTVSSWASSWIDILDSTNYTSYTVTKTGSGASGTWGISISGNAATATKATSATSATSATTAGTCTGNSASATKLATARNFSISGGATAAAVSFNGTGNATLSVTSLNTDYLNNGSNTLILACGGA